MTELLQHWFLNMLEGPGLPHSKHPGGLDWSDLWPLQYFHKYPLPTAALCLWVTGTNLVLDDACCSWQGPKSPAQNGFFCWAEAILHLWHLSGGCQANAMSYLRQEHSWQGKVTNSWFCAAFFGSKLINKMRRSLPLRHTQFFRLHCSYPLQTRNLTVAWEGSKAWAGLQFHYHPKFLSLCTGCNYSLHKESSVSDCLQARVETEVRQKRQSQSLSELSRILQNWFLAFPSQLRAGSSHACPLLSRYSSV